MNAVNARESLSSDVDDDDDDVIIDQLTLIPLRWYEDSRTEIQTLIYHVSV